MRSIFLTLLSLAAATTTLAASSSSASDDSWDEKQPDTVFNGQPVPPMTELGETNIKKEISKGNWFVEFFSPECSHCIHFKPTYQTAYEFYYTSKPILSKEDTEGDSLNSFTRYYDFKFAKVDCIAFADVCKAHTVTSYPVIIYFKDGKEVQRVGGQQDMKGLSKWIEQLLEAIRPGSRKEGGPKLPKTGAKSVETGPDTEEVIKEKQKEEAKEKMSLSSTAKAAPTKAANAAATKPKVASKANPSGVVEMLTGENFDDIVTNTQDPWFIKFYAPWCHHCLALAPTWANLARQTKGKLNIGEVNCEAEQKLCKTQRIRGYPTIALMRGSERIEYDGLRGIGDFLDYAEKVTSIGDGIVDIDAAGFKKLEETEEVIFTYFYDHATTSEDFQALERLLLSLVGHGKIVKTNDKELYDRFKISTWPRLMVSRDGKPTYYPPTTPKDMRDSKKVLTWMKSVWLPILPELTSASAREIMDGKIVVLGILNRDRSDEFVLSKRELKSAALEWIDKQEAAFKAERQELRDAKQLRIDEAEDKDDQRALGKAKSIQINMNELQRNQVAFAWVDGVFWDRWIKSTYGVDVKDGERVIINDEDNHRYWDTTAAGEPIRLSRATILETIGKVTSKPPQIPSKSTSGWFMGFFISVHRMYNNHPFLLLGMVVGSFTALILFGRRGRRRGYSTSGPRFKIAEKDGLLGGGNNGGAKHD